MKEGSYQRREKAFAGPLRPATIRTPMMTKLPTKTLSPIQNPSVLLTTSINAATSAKRMAATSATRFLDSRLRPTVSGTAIPNNTIGREMLNNAWKGTIPPAQTQFTPAQCPW